jgi:hypothetical protein
VTFAREKEIGVCGNVKRVFLEMVEIVIHRVIHGLFVNSRIKLIITAVN